MHPDVCLRTSQLAILNPQFADKRGVKYYVNCSAPGMMLGSALSRVNGTGRQVLPVHAGKTVQRRKGIRMRDSQGYDQRARTDSVSEFSQPMRDAARLWPARSLSRNGA